MALSAFLAAYHRSPHVDCTGCSLSGSIVLTVDDGTEQITVTKVVDENLGEREIERYGKVKDGFADVYLRMSVDQAWEPTAKGSCSIAAGSRCSMCAPSA